MSILNQYVQGMWGNPRGQQPHTVGAGSAGSGGMGAPGNGGGLPSSGAPPQTNAPSGPNMGQNGSIMYGLGMRVPPFSQASQASGVGPNFGPGGTGGNMGQMNYQQQPFGNNAMPQQQGYAPGSLMDMWGHLRQPQMYGQMGLQQLGGFVQQTPDFLSQLQALLAGQGQGQGGVLGAPSLEPAPPPLTPGLSGVPQKPGIDPTVPYNPSSLSSQQPGFGADWQTQRMQSSAPMNPGGPTRGQYHGIFGNPGGYDHRSQRY